jgi:hypothetical protein
MIMYCEYGCGSEAIFKLKNGKDCCSKRTSSCPEQKRKNSEATKKVHDSGKRLPMNLVYKQLPEETKNKMNWNKGNYSGTLFEYNGVGNHKAVLIQERGHRCEDCGLTEWKSTSIPLELEHVDGNNRNNTKDNLKLLCCNCHALTPTWRGRNINSGKVKVSDQMLLTAYAKCSNIRQALIEVGLAAKGGNYSRMKKLIATVVE